MPTVYDELPYPGAPYAQTHPDRLATMATLFGMTPAAVERCRVLELGCGDGGNVIPMAFALPESRFLGVDLSASAIARGHELIRTLSLSNITLQHLDLMEMTRGSGEFDYIIAHGLYSWVPPAAREQILKLCKSHLAPHGVAFISYNTYPGGHLRDTIREMMQYHTRGVTRARERVDRARELLEFLVEAHAGSDDVYAVFLRAEMRSFLERKPEHFFHDELNEHNARFHFHEFMEQAGRHGLQYLSEARLASMQTGVYPPEVSQKLRTFCHDDEIAKEQYLDFLKLRNLRQTLLCHKDIQVERIANTQRVMSLSAATDAKPSSPEPDVRSDKAEEFRYPKGGAMSTNHPLAKAAILHLGRIWPEAVPFRELLRVARSLSGRNAAESAAPSQEDANWLADMILKLFAANFLELHVHAPSFACQASERPASSALARAQVRERSEVTNLRHASVEVQDEAARQLLALLDGTHNRRELLEQLRARGHSSEITAEQLEANLAKLANLALLAA